MDVKQVNQMIDLLNQTEKEGNYSETARLYEQILTILHRALRDGNTSVEQVLRSLAFNYAHFLNKRFREYAKALKAIDLGMTCHPTPFGVSVAMAAKGEALWALGRKEEAIQAFNAGVEAHPANGRIEGAFCMVRLGDPALYPTAAQWVEGAVRDYGDKLNENAQWPEQINAVRRAVAQPAPPAPKASLWQKLTGKR